jgi:hypothetical protein
VWQEEQFALKIFPDAAHYVMWLGIGLLIWCLLKPLPDKNSEIVWNWASGLVSVMVAFFAATVFGLNGFVLCAASSMSLFSSLRSVREAMGLTLILYICRPWEVLPANDWWAQVPRQCIWLWLVAWLKATAQHPLQILNATKISRGIGLTLIFATWCLFTTLVSRDSAGSQQYFIDTLFRAITLVVILHLTVSSVADVERLQLAFVVGVTTLALFSLWRFHGLDQTAPFELLQRNWEQSQDRRLEAVGSLGNSNDIAAVIMIPLGFLWPTLLDPKISIAKRTATATIVFFCSKPFWRHKVGAH